MQEKNILKYIRKSQVGRLLIPFVCLVLFGVLLILFPGRPLLYVLTAVPSLFFLWQLMLFFFPKLSRTYRRLNDYGDADEILKEAERELSDDWFFKHNDLALTPKYLFEFNGDETAIIPLTDVLWLFRYESLAYSFRERREQLHYNMRIVTITGDRFTLRNKQKEDLDGIMDLIVERYPNFFYGYSEEHDRMVHYILEENRRELNAKRT